MGQVRKTFTTQVQDDVGAPRMSTLPASSETVVSYLGGLSWLISTLLGPQELGVKWTGHSLRRGGASVVYAIGVSIDVIMDWGLWKSLASELLYIDVAVRLSSEALFFFGHLLTHFLPQSYGSTNRSASSANC